MKEEQYAPIIIPTLCRYEHLKTLLSSLAKCSGAKYTDVYIGLDYPLNDSHRDGYEKIKILLNNGTYDRAFRSLNIFERERNYGAERNINSLIDFIKQKYDRWIFSEDDNIFSPNFLDYMNKGLKIYENDPTVLAINGYRQLPELLVNGNTIIRQNNGFSAWGFGIWRDKYNNMIEDINNGYFQSIMFNLPMLCRIKKNGWSRLRTFFELCFSKKQLPFADYVANVYMAAKNLDVIMPVVSTVRNCGWDGTGQNCRVKDKNLIKAHMEQVIDDKSFFDFKGDPSYAYKENKRIFVKQGYSKISVFTFIKSLMVILLKQIIRK